MPQTFIKAKPVSWCKLYDRQERAIAKLATIAQNDCIDGGARALTLSVRLGKMGSPTDYDSVVSAAYTDSRGFAAEYRAHECGECGAVHLGKQAAIDCCNFDECDE